MTSIKDAVLDRMDALSEAEVWRLERLSSREKVLLSLAAEVCLPATGLERQLELARRHGVPARAMRDAIRFVAYESGYALASAAMSALGPDTNDDPVSAEAIGEAAVEDVNPMPPPVQAQLAALDPRFARFMVMQSRMRRDHLTSLTQRERGMISMTADIMCQTLGETFRVHAGRAHRGGADAETLREVVCFAAPYGVTRVWNALEALNGFVGSLAAP